MIVYFEHYPHYAAGTIDTKVEITDENFALLLALVESDSEEGQDLVESEGNGTEDFFVTKPKRGPYAFEAAVFDYGDGPQRVKEILRAFKSKGYWAGEWEEGSFAFALEGFEEDAINALARIEARVARNSFDF